MCRFVKGLYLARWLDTQFQSQVESMSLTMIQCGNINYSSLHGRATGPGWSRSCEVEPGEVVQIDGSSDVLEECMEFYEPQSFLPSTLADVEDIQNFRFKPSEQMEAPRDLFQHEDMTTTTRLRSEFRHIFEHSASAIYFWQQVIGEMNTYARIHDVALRAPVTLQDVMTFMGVLFYMALVDKGEYSNYGGIQVEDSSFGGSSVGFDTIMTLRRFKQLCLVFTFQCVPQNSTNQDQTARVRPLLNFLKSTGSRYIAIGRNVTLDEAGVACRSKYGKPLIVYNLLKSGGNTITDRLAGVTTADEAQALSEEISESSVICQCVLEVVRPVYGTHWIVNSDNYYTFVQLLTLRVKGLYSRGTVPKSSSHFPWHVLVEKKDCSPGSSRQAVSRAHGIVAASCAPTYIRQYNTYTQGVDRLDQIRGRFSVADG
ncbi:Transposase [Phytophthora palmivora]|uniref:Transposase n=1 Tax=Phytophthora palmivora TaxID=4796 RepID=A0A2P4YM26_9STRA|nr:Transposase [Phytophthora palmivora]